MPGIKGLVALISAAVVAELAATNMPALTDGKILLGRQHIYAHSAPPRVVFVPVASPFLAKDVSSSGQLTVGSLHAVEAGPGPRQQWLQRSIATEAIRFDVHVWGAAGAPDPDDDFDATQLLYQSVIRCTNDLVPGFFQLHDGQWNDQQDGATQLDKLGHYFVFGLSIMTPVPDLPLVYAPSDVTTEFTAQLNPGDGSPPEDV